METLEEYDEAELLVLLEARMKEALLEGKTELNITDMGISPEKYDLYSLLYFSPYLSNGIDFMPYYSLNTNCYTNIKWKMLCRWRKQKHISVRLRRK